MSNDGIKVKEGEDLNYVLMDKQPNLNIEEGNQNKKKKYINNLNNRNDSELKLNIYNKNGSIKMILNEIEEESPQLLTPGNKVKSIDKDLVSMKDSDLDSKELNEKMKNERYGIIVGILTQIVWAFMSLQLKTYFKFFPKYYSRNNLLFWRSVPISILGYIIATKKGQKIIRISEINYKGWFFTRSLGNYFILSTFIYMLNFFRVSTCQCIAGTHTIIVLFFSIFIINEPFYMRYIYGVILSFLGSSLIVLNERRSTEREQSLNKNILLGVFVSVCYVFMLASSKFAQKMMCKEHISGEIQNFYMGLLNALPALIVILYDHNIGLNFLYILYAMSNGILFYIANYYTAVCFNNIPVSKYLPITYLTQVFIFIFGFIFLGEKVYITDVIGSLFVCGFQVYNAWFPRKVNRKNNNN